MTTTCGQGGGFLKMELGKERGIPFRIAGLGVLPDTSRHRYPACSLSDRPRHTRP